MKRSRLATVRAMSEKPPEPPHPPTETRMVRPGFACLSELRRAKLSASKAEPSTISPFRMAEKA